PRKAGACRQLQPPRRQCNRRELLTVALEANRLGLLRELLPQATAIAALVDPNFPTTPDQLKDLKDAARALGQQLHVFQASTESELANGFAALVQQQPHALIVAAGPFFTARRKELVALADRHRIAAIYFLREFPAAGGLISYGPSLTDALRQVGVYTGRILIIRGEKPAELRVLQPTKYELIINTTPAKSLGLQVPDKLLALADEVIE